MLFKSLRNLLTTYRIYQRNLQGRKFEPEAPFMEYAVSPGDTCLHFGASDGRHSYLLSKFIGDEGKVLAYEPSNYSFKIMDRLIKWHKLKNVHPRNAAIGSGEGEINLNVPVKTTGHLGRAYAVIGEEARGSEQLLASANDTKFEVQRTKVVSLDGLMEKEDLDKVDFIRCDVEGAEIEFIRGGRGTLEKHLPNLLIEIHPFSLERNFSTSAEYVRDFFLSLGYRMWQLDDADENLYESTEIDPKRRWKDYFLIHPSRKDSLPDGIFKKAL